MDCKRQSTTMEVNSLLGRFPKGLLSRSSRSHLRPKGFQPKNSLTFIWLLNVALMTSFTMTLECPARKCYNICMRGWILQHLSSPAGRINANSGALRNQCDGGARVLARTLLLAIRILFVSFRPPAWAAWLFISFLPPARQAWLFLSFDHQSVR